MNNASTPSEIRPSEPEPALQQEPDPPNQKARCLHACRDEPIVVPLGVGVGLCYRCARQRGLV